MSGSMERVLQLPLSRRTLLRTGALAGAAGLSAPALAACGGFGESGGEGGKLVFMSTQFKPVEEGERFRKILVRAHQGGVDYIAADSAAFTSRLQAEQQAKKVSVNLIGGLYGDLAPYAPDGLEDLTDVAEKLSDRDYPADVLELAKFGTDKTYFIPWMQATFILAVNKKALEYLPSGADVNALTYDQFLAWARAGRAKHGRPVFGLPAGPKGLLHRFFQGYLYPSFTGGQITTFRSDEAVQMWEYLKELWRNCVPASTRFEFMQEPLAGGDVQVGWDHVARLVGAPAQNPEGFVMVPAPAGPEGRGYMPVLAGLAIPKGAPRKDDAIQLIQDLSKPEIQIEVLRQNAFFPAVKAEVPEDLPPAVRLEAKAVDAQQNSSDALLSLAPVGLGAGEPELSKVFRDSFGAIVLRGENIRSTLDKQGAALQKLLDAAKVPCWRPDPDSGDQTCTVG